MVESVELGKIVGSQHVFEDATTLEGFSGDLSFVPKIRPRSVVRPENAEQVKRIVEWANETLTPLVPVSSGPPHFRGDSVPSVGGAVIVDLSKMKRIRRIDPQNRVAMVEPGVTFTELQAALHKEGLCAYTPLCPRLPKSVVGSMLEREPITMPAHHWDVTDPMLCAEIVFGTGDILRGGEAAGPDTIEEQWEIGKAQMTPMGLSQFNEHRLISGAQGTIGIVTWSTLKCRLISTVNRMFFIPSEKMEPLIELSYRLLRIRLGDHCFILNNLNLACLLAGTTQEIKQLRDSLPPWVLVVSFEGYGELPDEKVRYQEADFMDMVRSDHMEPVDRIHGASTEELSALLSMPSKEPYWKLRYKGDCHDIFFLTTFDKIPGFVATTSDLSLSEGHPMKDVGVYVQPLVQGTSCHCEFNLYTDPSEQNEMNRIKSLVTDGSRELARKGGFFSRPYGPWTDFAYHGAAETIMLQRKVKKIFDPNDILNPAKLCL